MVVGVLVEGGWGGGGCSSRQQINYIYYNTDSWSGGGCSSRGGGGGRGEGVFTRTHFSPLYDIYYVTVCGLVVCIQLTRCYVSHRRRFQCPTHFLGVRGGRVQSTKGQ